MTHPQMIRPSVFVADAPEDDETPCADETCNGVADGYVRCQSDPDALCDEHMSQHVSQCPRCAE